MLSIDNACVVLSAQFNTFDNIVPLYSVEVSDRRIKTICISFLFKFTSIFLCYYNCITLFCNKEGKCATAIHFINIAQKIAKQILFGPTKVMSGHQDYVFVYMTVSSHRCAEPSNFTAIPIIAFTELQEKCHEPQPCSAE